MLRVNLPSPGSPLTRVTALLLAGFLLQSQASPAQESPVSGSQGVNLTIYNQNFGLVRDTRKIDLKEGVNFVRVEDVAAQIDPTSVSFSSITAPNAVVVREQNYQYDLLNPTSILKKSVGKSVKFRQTLPSGAVRELSGILLNPPEATVSDTEGNIQERSQGLVLKTPEGVILNPEGQAELAELPKGLVSKPSLLWKLETTRAGKHDTEIAYQTQGLNWKCDYVAVANADDSKADLTSWVTLDNKSGATYEDAALKLMAGDVHKVSALPPPAMPMAMGGAVAEAAMPPPQFKEQAFAEYHLYTLQGNTTVRDNETKQLSLFNAADVPVKKLFIFEPDTAQYFMSSPDGGEQRLQKVAVKLELQNSEANHLGMPMPKGKVRVYKQDSDGALQFVGEDSIDHTPRDEKVRLYIGDAFDVVAERRQTNMEQVSNRVQRMSYETKLRNHKSSAVTLTVVEHAGGEWSIKNSSHQYKKRDSRTYEFTVDVPANGEVTLTYTVEVRY